MKKVLMIASVLVFSIQSKVHCQSDDRIDALGGEDALYIGLKAGLPYLAGIDLGYLIANENRVRFYLNASVQSIIILNSANMGAGYFIGKKGFSIGVRYNRYAHIIDSAISDEDYGSTVGPELGWFREVGKSKSTIISLQLGPTGLSFGFGARIW